MLNALNDSRQHAPAAPRLRPAEDQADADALWPEGARLDDGATSSSPLARPGLTPAPPRKRLPSPQAVRWRYKLARWVLVMIGGLVAVIIVETALANLTARGLAPDLVFYALALLLLAVGLGVPWLLVEVLWRWKGRRHDWGP